MYMPGPTVGPVDSRGRPIAYAPKAQASPCGPGLIVAVLLGLLALFGILDKTVFAHRAAATTGSKAAVPSSGLVASYGSSFTGAPTGAMKPGLVTSAPVSTTFSLGNPANTVAPKAVLTAAVPSPTPVVTATMTPMPVPVPVPVPVRVAAPAAATAAPGMVTMYSGTMPVPVAAPLAAPVPVPVPVPVRVATPAVQVAAPAPAPRSATVAPATMTLFSGTVPVPLSVPTPATTAAASAPYTSGPVTAAVVTTPSGSMPVNTASAAAVPTSAMAVITTSVSPVSTAPAVASAAAAAAAAASPSASPTLSVTTTAVSPDGATATTTTTTQTLTPAQAQNLAQQVYNNQSQTCMQDPTCQAYINDCSMWSNQGCTNVQKTCASVLGPPSWPGNNCTMGVSPAKWPNTYAMTPLQLAQYNCCLVNYRERTMGYWRAKQHTHGAPPLGTLNPTTGVVTMAAPAPAPAPRKSLSLLG